MENNKQVKTKQKSKKNTVLGIVFGSIGLGALIAGSTVLGLTLTNKDYITIKFNANGGELSSDTETRFKNGSTFKDINKPTFKTKPTGKEFAYWSYDEAGQKRVNDSDQISSASIVYAQWCDELTLTFKAIAPAGETIQLVGPTTIGTNSKTKFGDINKPRATKEKSGYKCYFDYWSTTGTKDGKISDDTLFETNTTIYPVFKDEEIVAHHTMTFQPCIADKDKEGTTVTFNGFSNFQISLSEKNTFGNTNKPSVTKTVKAASGQDLTYSFLKWVKNVDGVESDVNDNETFKTDSIISPVFKEEPQAFESRIYIKDDTGKMGAIVDSTEYKGDKIRVLWQDGSDKTFEKDQFNEKIYFGSEVTTIEPNFLGGCKAFNQEITLPSTITSIGTGFLSGADAFNNGATGTATDKPLSIPSSVKYIDSNFLKDDISFNQPIVFNNGLLTIGDFFLAFAEKFNSPITFPNTLYSIGDYFLTQTPSKTTEFNQSITFPSSLTSLGSYCMQYCYSKEGKDSTGVVVDLSNTALTKINNSFLYRAYYFKGEVKLPTSIKTIGNDFMAYINKEDSAFKVNIGDLADLETIGNNCFNNCTGFNQEINLSKCTKLTTIGYWFLRTNKNLNKPVTLPDSGSLKYIGTRFMQACTSFNQPITIPAMDNGTDYAIGPHFMSGCNAMTSVITLKTPLEKFDRTKDQESQPNKSLTLIRNTTNPNFKYAVKYANLPDKSLSQDLLNYFSDATVVDVALLESINIKEPASTLSFEVGKNFNSNGLKLNVVFKDRTEEVSIGYTCKLGAQNLSDYTFQASDVGNDKEVTVEYLSKTCTYKINVILN